MFFLLLLKIPIVFKLFFFQLFRRYKKLLKSYFTILSSLKNLVKIQIYVPVQQPKRDKLFDSLTLNVFSIQSELEVVDIPRSGTPIRIDTFERPKRRPSWICGLCLECLYGIFRKFKFILDCLFLELLCFQVWSTRQPPPNLTET